MYSFILSLVTLVLLLLVTGVFWGPWLALHRKLDAFTKEELIKITRVMADNLGRPMQILMPVCLLSLLASVVWVHDKNPISFYLFLSSLVCFILTLVVTLTTELPIVNKIKSWTAETIPDNWEEIRNKWVHFHSLRVFPAIAGFILYVLGVLLSAN